MSIAARPVTFADVIPVPLVKARSAILVVGFALLTALAAQVTINFSWSIAPITGLTFAAVLAGGILGSRLGALSQLVYLVGGLVLPFYTDGHHGWSYFSGNSAGYIVGLAFAAYVVGLLAERREDRSILTSIPAMLFGSAIVYVFSAVWLAHSADLSASAAIAQGVAPYVFGAFLTSVVAGVVLPIAWKLTKSTGVEADAS
jgi:biotin transport system substrate-specific component